jgi:hypothetical protein
LSDGAKTGTLWCRRQLQLRARDGSRRPRWIRIVMEWWICRSTPQCSCATSCRTRSAGRDSPDEGDAAVDFSQASNRTAPLAKSGATTGAASRYLVRATVSRAARVCRTAARESAAVVRVAPGCPAILKRAIPAPTVATAPPRTRVCRTRLRMSRPRLTCAGMVVGEPIPNHRSPTREPVSVLSTSSSSRRRGKALRWRPWPASTGSGSSGCGRSSASTRPRWCDVHRASAAVTTGIQTGTGGTVTATTFLPVSPEP